MTLTVITPPAAEPLTVAELQAQLRWSSSDESALLAAYIVAARRAAEAFLHRRLITQTVRLTLTAFCPQLALPIAPVQSVDQVAYTDADGDEAILDPARYRLATAGLPTLLVPAYGQEWPVPRNDWDSVRIDLIVGYGAAGSDVPADILQGLRLLAAHMFQNRDATAAPLTEIPFGVRSLWDPHIFWL